MKNPWKQTCHILTWAASIGAIACGLPTIARAQQAVHPESQTPEWPSGKPVEPALSRYRGRAFHESDCQLNRSMQHHLIG
jgi:hypothetical protein